MRGEVSDPSDKQRMKELNRDINKLCKETDLRLAGLKRKYSANPAVMRGLNQFEVQIEAGPTQQGH